MNKRMPRNKAIGSKSSHVVKNFPAYVSVDVKKKKRKGEWNASTKEQW